MSDVKGANKTLIDAGTTLAPGLFDGRVKCIVDTYEASTLANPSTIKMGGKITKGAVVLGGILAFDNLGASVALSVGDAEVAARYLSGLAAATGDVVLLDVVDGIGYTTDETDPDALDTQFLITIGGSGTVSGTIKLIMLIAND